MSQLIGIVIVLCSLCVWCVCVCMCICSYVHVCVCDFYISVVDWFFKMFCFVLRVLALCRLLELTVI